MQTVSNVIYLMHLALAPVLEKAAVVVDATAGNGHDTLFLAEHTPKTAQIYAFDIQPEALEQTKRRTAAYAERIHYLLCSHANMESEVEKNIDVCIFNLGYLPGASHEEATKMESTRKAVLSVLQKLNLHGVCVIVVYPGHPEGAIEAEELSKILANLPCKEFSAGCYRLCNHKAAAPYAYLIERVK